MSKKPTPRSQMNEKPSKTTTYQKFASSKSRPQSADDDIADFARVNYLQVTRNQHEQRLDNFLLSRLKGLPKSHLYKLIRADEVRINNKRCKPHDKLYRGDVVRIAPVRLPSREAPVISADFAQSLLARVVYEDDGLLVLNKPSGMAVHGGSGDSFGVIEAMREVTGKKYLELVHRIDKDTSGLLMIAKKRSTLKQLQQYLHDKHIQKHYLCLVRGHVVMDEQDIDAPLLRYTLANGERRVRVDVQDSNSKPSQTHIRCLARWQITAEQMATTQRQIQPQATNDGNGKQNSKGKGNEATSQLIGQSSSQQSHSNLSTHSKSANTMPVSLVQASPATGRTHQIRVHLAHIGHPLLGDDKYHPQDASLVRRLCLHAWQLHIPDYPPIHAAIPEDMVQWLPKGLAL